MTERGFTLIELIIVLAIMGILAALIIGSCFGNEKKEFMADCTKQEPKYICQEKWAKMHPDALVVYAPFNR